MDVEKVKKLVTELLIEIGEDKEREGLIKTPERVAKAYEFLTSGYTSKVEDIVNDAIFEEGYDEMVIVKDIDFFSLCEHHILPFFGKFHIAYIPNGRVIGLSKIPRIVDAFSRKLQIQERLTNEIADKLNEIIKPKGVAVVAEGYHMCMMMRGVQKQNAFSSTSAMRGLFRSDARTRAEFLNLISKK